MMTKNFASKNNLALPSSRIYWDLPTVHRRRRRKKRRKIPTHKSIVPRMCCSITTDGLDTDLANTLFFLSNHNGPHLSTLFSRKKQEEIFIYWMIGSTMPQANRFPAFPVFRLSGLPPRPKSSSVAWTTKARPLMSFTWPFCKGQTISELIFWCQIKEIERHWNQLTCSVTKVSRILTEVKSSSGLTMFPRSPTCLLASFWGWPWSRCSKTKLQD